MGSVLVYRFTRTDPRDTTMFNSLRKVRKERSTMVIPLSTGIPGHNRARALQICYFFAVLCKTST